MRRRSIPGAWRAAFACLFVAAELVGACTQRLDTSSTVTGTEAALSTASRRTLDDHFRAWCEVRKGLPETPGVCACVTDQLHIQATPDDAARRLVALVDSAGNGSDPSFEQLPPGDLERLKRAADLCGARLP